jgi:MFS family permease
MKINLLYKLLIASYATSMFSEGIILPIYAVFVQNIGGDILDASSAMAVFLITEGIFTFLVHKSKWVQRHRIPVMVAGWAIWVIGIASYLAVSSIATLFATQILTAIGNALADPIFDQELANHTDKKSEEFEWGFFEGINSIVQGFGALLGGLVAAIFGFKTLLSVMALTATLSLALILVYIQKIKQMKARVYDG